MVFRHMGFHSYYVKYIERGGRVTKRIFLAHDAAGAKERASESGCDDILGARPARFFTRFFMLLAAIAFLVAAAVVASMFFS